MEQPLTGKDIRQTEKREKKKVCRCFCCGKHPYITQKHHIVPLATIARLLSDSLINNFTNRTIYLCPNCHSYVHLILKQMEKNEITPCVDASSKVLKKMIKLAQQSISMEKNIVMEKMFDTLFFW